MEGKCTFAEFSELTFAEYDIYYINDYHLRRLTAQKARAKLDDLTVDGLCKMDDDEWFAFTEVWPHFEILNVWDEGGSFKGEWHYRSGK